MHRDRRERQNDKDLAVCIHGNSVKSEHYLNTEEFLDALNEGLIAKLGA